MATLLTRKEAAIRLGISEDTLDAERTEGHLAYIQRKPGGCGSQRMQLLSTCKGQRIQ